MAKTTQVFSFNENALKQKQAQLKAAKNQMQNLALNYASIYAPKKTGALIASATITQNDIIYTAKYARYQYYNTPQTRPYDANRGANWFNKMKIRHKDIILQQISKSVGAKAGETNAR